MPTAVITMLTICSFVLGLHIVCFMVEILFPGQRLDNCIS